MLRQSRIDPPLRADEIDEVIAEELGMRLLPRGFEQVSRRSWVRSSAAPIRHEVGIGALKGYSFAPGWSVSLDFVPHVTKTGRVAWHRTAKQHHGDLSIDPLDYPTQYDVDVLVVQGMRSLKTFRKALKRSSDLTVHHAETWFEPITDLPGLIAAFERAEAHDSPRFGFDNYVQHRLAFAFVLAAAGESERGAAELDRWCVTHAADEDIAAELRRLLAATCS
jgi:hypothetical protein